MGVPLSDRVAVHPSVICRELAGETVLLNLESGVYYGLDSVGTRVWQLLQRDNTLADVCATMIDEFDISPDVLRDDVASLVSDLYEKGLLTPRHAAQS